MKNFFKKLYHRLNNYLSSEDSEKSVILFFIRGVNIKRNFKILDVGCGYGRNMISIKENLQGIDIDGVDANDNIVKVNKDKGLSCYTIEEFENIEKKYDLLIFSHIIEHFAPNELKMVLESYFARLKDDGHVIISTPLLWKGFYWDFDHIKPYHPIGINMVFGANNAQVQYYSKYKLELLDIRFRKTPYIVDYKKGIYIKDSLSKVWMVINLVNKLLFKCSCGIFGTTTAWMGLYKKNTLIRSENN